MTWDSPLFLTYIVWGKIRRCRSPLQLGIKKFRYSHEFCRDLVALQTNTCHVFENQSTLMTLIEGFGISCFLDAFLHFAAQGSHLLCHSGSNADFAPFRLLYYSPPLMLHPKPLSIPRKPPVRSLVPPPWILLTVLISSQKLRLYLHTNKLHLHPGWHAHFIIYKW